MENMKGEIPRAAATNMTIIDAWTKVKAPLAPELKPVKIEAKTTALLILDMVSRFCNADERPRCAATVPKIQRLLTIARDKGMTVVYSLTNKNQPAEITTELTPRAGEPIVSASVDKFVNTDLGTILTAKGITSVIITGTSANGAVLGTATGAAIRGIKPIVPVDTFSAEELYAEQYAAWHIVNAPSIRDHSVLTSVDLLSF